MTEERMTALVLAADDDEDILQLVRMVLEEDEYEVVTARDGQQALELAIEMRPDLCVFDVMMPLLDGCEVTKRMRAAAPTRDIPILLLSARTQWEAVMRGKEAGADEYVTKPFIPDDLQRSVRSLLAAPRPPAADPLLGVMEGGEEPEPPVQQGLVLVAARDQNLVKLIGYCLKLGGYEVASAHDADQAMQLALERRPDLCVLDASIPQLDGFPVKRVAPGVSVQELYGDVERMMGGLARQRTA